MKQIGVMLGFVLAVSSAVSMPSTQPSDPRQDDAAKTAFGQRLNEAHTGNWDVVFIGDGYVKGWGGSLEGKPVWTTCFSDAGLKALNLGFAGDRTEHLLWRIQAGELDGYKAKTVVLEIGGENRVCRGERETVLDTLAGIWRCLQAIRTKQPDARVVLHPVFPRARKPTDPSRLHAAAVNRELVKFADGKDIVWCDFTDGLLEADGSLPIELIPYHYQPAYLYRLWGAALQPMLGGKGTVCPQRYANRLPAGMFDSGEIRECSGRSKIGIRNSWDPFPNWWLERSIGKREEAWELSEGGKKPIDLVFLGDSITHNWDGDRQSGWPMPGTRRLADLRKRYSVLPIGFGGDDTSTLLWRVKNGHIDGYRARLVQLMIGTNNVLSSPEETARGIRAILDEIIRRQPTAKVLLLPVFPCGEKPDYVMRRRNAAVNKIIRKYADGKRILWHDFTGRFVQPDGTISKKMMGDFLHPGADGYDIWYEEVLPIFEKVLREP